MSIDSMLKGIFMPTIISDLTPYMEVESVDERVYLAEHGTDADRDHLIHDPDQEVRCMVAQFGNVDHVERLSCDINPRVSNHATYCHRVQNVVDFFSWE